MLQCGLASSGDRLTVLWLVKGLGPGGMERLLVTHARLADHDRFRYLLGYMTERPSSLQGELEQAGVEVRSLGRSPLGMLASIRRWCVDEGVDVVHSHSPLLAFMARASVRLRRLRPALLTTDHSTWSTYSWPTRVVHGITYPMDDAHVAVSAAAAASPPRWLAHPPPQVILHGSQPRLNTSVEPDLNVRQIRDRLGVSDRATMVLTLANHRPAKGYDNLIAAAQLLAIRTATSPDGPSPIVIVAAGAGPGLERDRELVDRLGLCGTLKLVGHRDDVDSLLRAADAFVLASYNEGLPVALMEATTAGLAIVATAVGGVPEALPGTAGTLLVPPGDPQALADAMERLGDRDLRQRMSEASLQAARSFDAPAAVAAQEALYQELRRL